MARRNGAGLVDIGREAFATLEWEESHVRTTRPPPPRQEPQQPLTNRIQQPFWSNRRSNMQFVSDTTYNTTPTKENGAIDCNQAANKYGGVLIKETGKRKSPFGFRRG